MSDTCQKTNSGKNCFDISFNTCQISSLKQIPQKSFKNMPILWVEEQKMIGFQPGVVYDRVQTISTAWNMTMRIKYMLIGFGHWQTNFPS